MQTTANRTVANSLPKNEVIFLTLLISKRYIPYTDLRKISGITSYKGMYLILPIQLLSKISPVS